MIKHILNISDVAVVLVSSAN